MSVATTIRVAHSPDSDDAFMFYALATGKVDTGDREYVHELADIETLNRRALEGDLDLTAVSFHAYAWLHQRYALLSHGASVGDGYGPRLVAGSDRPADSRRALAGKLVAIPGERTTAALALRLYQPDAATVVVPFDRIEDAVVRGEAEVGLLIHEGQLTYADRGLKLWEDLGDWWRRSTGLPLPLGGNAVRRDLGPDLVRAVSRDLKASIRYALAHREEALAHAARYARGLDGARTDTFVGMYVNEETVELSARSREAVRRLLDEGWRAGLLPSSVPVDFVAD
jgi:1,4-dihydroxy-6-naphthoate synthase